MRRRIHTKSFDPSAGKAGVVVVRVRTSYLLGRWTQSPIFGAVREADT